MHVVIAFVHHFSMVWICQHIQCTDPLWIQRLMLQDFLRRVSDTLGLRFLHSTLPLVLMGIHNLVTSAIWIEVIVFMLLIHVIYLCYKSSSTVCVSIPIQGWHLSTETWSIRVGSYKMVSEHMLTVGRDPRNWQAHSKDFSLQLSLSKRSFTSLLFWAYSKFPFSETIPLSPFDHTKIQLMRPLHEL